MGNLYSPDTYPSTSRGLRHLLAWLGEPGVTSLDCDISLDNGCELNSWGDIVDVGCDVLGDVIS
jgi:hypothetical protein